METISETIRNPAILHWIHDNPLLVLREQCQLKDLDGDEIQIRTGEPAALSERHTIITEPKTGEWSIRRYLTYKGLARNLGWLGPSLAPHKTKTLPNRGFQVG